MPRDADFNLLKGLQALLEERSVSRAAERLGISQPAASSVLAKLRRHFHDELLIRVGNSYRLSPIALQLTDRVAEAVTVANRVFSLQPEFDPATSQREFVLVLSDYSIRVLGPAITRRLHAEAPDVRLHLRQVTTDVVDGAPESLRHIDAFVLPHGVLNDMPYEDLIDDEWVCMVAAGHPAAGRGLTAADLAELPWVAIFHRPTAFTTAVRELRLHGIEPRVRMVSESYWTLPALLVGTDRVALIQRRVADLLAAVEPVLILPCPVPVAPLKLALWWHPVHTSDPAHRWLRAVVTDAALHSG